MAGFRIFIFSSLPTQFTVQKFCLLIKKKIACFQEHKIIDFKAIKSGHRNNTDRSPEPEYIRTLFPSPVPERVWTRPLPDIIFDLKLLKGILLSENSRLCL